MRPRTVVPLCAAALLLALGACGSDDADADAEAAPPSETQAMETDPATTEPDPATTEPSPAPTTEPAEVAVPEELDFTAPTVDGGTFEGASLAGQPAVLWFWAPWCPVCQGEAPLIADLAEQYAGQVSFVGVAGLSGDLGAMEDFIADGGVEAIPHIDDRDGGVYTRFGVTQQYDIGFVSADGTVEVVRGPLDESEIVAEIERIAAG